MSRVHYSFDSTLAATKPEGRLLRTPSKRTLPSRRYMRQAMENFGLFAFGFGSTNLLIHFAVGFFLAARMSSSFPPVHL